MRHRCKGNRLNRNSSHRKATLANLCTNLIQHGRIKTTVAKAKELRKDVERLVTIAKKDSVSARRIVKSRLNNLRYQPMTSDQQKERKNGGTECFTHNRIVLSRLFDEIAPRYVSRQGGYTRIVRAGQRVGDAAEMCYIEFVEA
ncbi:MAG: 50S ribosomal protein L17 [Chlamydiia bacterium]|nr:50S ribosomal protein L17 [Chlamydiia bacterium]